MIVTDPWATFFMELLVVTFGLFLVLRARDILRLDRQLRGYDLDPHSRSAIRGTGVVSMVIGLGILCLVIYRWIE